MTIQFFFIPRGQEGDWVLARSVYGGGGTSDWVQYSVIVRFLPFIVCDIIW